MIDCVKVNFFSLSSLDLDLKFKTCVCMSLSVVTINLFLNSNYSVYTLLYYIILYYYNTLKRFLMSIPYFNKL